MNLEVYFFFLFISESVTCSVNTSGQNNIAVFTIKWLEKWVGWLGFFFFLEMHKNAHTDAGFTMHFMFI